MKIKLSKSQWEEIGSKAGWIKVAQVSPPVPSNILVNGDGKPINFDFDSIKKEVESGNGTVYDIIKYRYSISKEEEPEISVIDNKNYESWSYEPSQIDMAVKKFMLLVRKIIKKDVNT